MTNAISELLETATLARSAAYAPYSGFRVGAALRTKSGRVFTGTNVENVSFGLTMCAERVCIGAAVAAGERQFERMVIVTDSPEPAVPCGACRQVIAEFSTVLPITSTTLRGDEQQFTIEELLPIAHQGMDVPHRT